ncbi:MAG: protein kinase [Clostridia bacterium]|nr:protein kinase [Clostridia bacterium]
MIDLSCVLPGWSAVEKIGEGSYGKVYKCINNDSFGITDECAVKIISIPMNESEIREVWAENPSEQAFKMHFREIVENFANEIKLMLTLNGSPNVVTIRSYKIIEHKNKIGWDIYICMDYLTPFTKYALKKAFTEQEIIKFGTDLCSALEVCSKYGIIHRDIKPDNIFIDKFGNFRLGDFGVAKQLENNVASMTRIGTMRYMAPEVYDGRKYDARADIYSLGMVMYKLLNNGRDPLTDPTKPYITDKEAAAASEMRRKGAKFPPPCNAGRELSRIILKACEFNPDYRYSNASEFRKDLEACLTTAPSETFTEVSTNLNNVPYKQYAPIDSRPVAPRSIINQPQSQPNPAYSQAQHTGYPPVAPVMPQPRPQPVPQPRPQQFVQPAPQKKTNYAPVIIAVFVTLALIAAAVIAVLFINKNKETEDTKNEKSVIMETEEAPSLEFIENGDIREAPSDEVLAEHYKNALDAYNRSDYKSAAILFGKAQNYSNAAENASKLWRYLIKEETVSAGEKHTVGLSSNGTVIATGSNEFGQINVSGWKNIISVSAGASHTVALKADGTVVATGHNEYGQCNVSDWKNIVAVSAGGFHTVGLKADGTVVATGFDKHDRCNLSDWQNIIAVSAGSDHTVGLKADGTVVAKGYNGNKQCDVESWRNIVAISSGLEHTVGLTENGTVVAAGSNKQMQCEVSGWSNVRCISARGYHTVASKTDGTVLATGLNENGQCNVNGESGVIDVAAGWYHTVLLKNDGTVVAAGDSASGQCGVYGWSKLKTIS